MTHTNEINEDALRQALKLRNEQKQALSPDFAQRVKAKMERRNRRRTLGLWIAAGSIAASLLIGVIWFESRKEPTLQAETVPTEILQTETVAQTTTIQASVAPSIDETVPQTSGQSLRIAAGKKVVPRETELPDVPDLTPEQIKQIQLEQEIIEQELMMREQTVENAIKEFEREWVRKEEEVIRECIAREEEFQKKLANL